MTERQPVPVRVVRPFAGFSVGHIIPEMPGGVRARRVASGYVVAVVDEAPVDRMVTESPVRPRRSGRRGAGHGPHAG